MINTSVYKFSMVLMIVKQYEPQMILFLSTGFKYSLSYLYLSISVLWDLIPLIQYIPVGNIVCLTILYLFDSCSYLVLYRYGIQIEIIS